MTGKIVIDIDDNGNCEVVLSGESDECMCALIGCFVSVVKDSGFPVHRALALLGYARLQLEGLSHAKN